MNVNESKKMDRLEHMYRDVRNETISSQVFFYQTVALSDLVGKELFLVRLNKGATFVPASPFLQCSDYFYVTIQEIIEQMAVLLPYTSPKLYLEYNKEGFDKLAYRTLFYRELAKKEIIASIPEQPAEDPFDGLLNSQLKAKTPSGGLFQQLKTSFPDFIKQFRMQKVPKVRQVEPQLRTIPAGANGIEKVYEMSFNSFVNLLSGIVSSIVRTYYPDPVCPLYHNPLPWVKSFLDGSISYAGWISEIFLVSENDHIFFSYADIEQKALITLGPTLKIRIESPNCDIRDQIKTILHPKNSYGYFEPPMEVSDFKNAFSSEDLNDLIIMIKLDGDHRCHPLNDMSTLSVRGFDYLASTFGQFIYFLIFLLYMGNVREVDPPVSLISQKLIDCGFIVTSESGKKIAYEMSESTFYDLVSKIVSEISNLPDYSNPLSPIQGSLPRYIFNWMKNYSTVFFSLLSDNGQVLFDYTQVESRFQDFEIVKFCKSCN